MTQETLSMGITIGFLMAFILIVFSIIAVYKITDKWT